MDNSVGFVAAEAEAAYMAAWETWAAAREAALEAEAAKAEAVNA